MREISFRSGSATFTTDGEGEPLAVLSCATSEVVLTYGDAVRLVKAFNAIKTQATIAKIMAAEKDKT